MNVELPTSGCNILTSATSFSNYSNNNRTRQIYYIYEGVAHLQSETTSTYGYDVSGTCLNTGDLVFHPEDQVYFPVISFLICFLIVYFIYALFIKRLLP